MGRAPGVRGPLLWAAWKIGERGRLTPNERLRRAFVEGGGCVQEAATPFSREPQRSEVLARAGTRWALDRGPDLAEDLVDLTA
jgi:hypothetical protein